MKVLLLAVALAGSVYADVYFHVPRGSNDRLNEHSANRNNANRLFDSQVFIYLLTLIRRILHSSMLE